MRKNYDPADPDSYRTFQPLDIEFWPEHGPFQRLYDVKGAFDALAAMMERGASPGLDEAPSDFEQRGVAHIIKALSQQAHDCAAWIEDHYARKEAEGAKAPGVPLRVIEKEVANG